MAVQSLLKSADGAGLHRADIAQEAQVAVAALQASAQGEVCPGMNTTYTVKHIQKGPTLFVNETEEVRFQASDGNAQGDTCHIRDNIRLEAQRIRERCAIGGYAWRPLPRDVGLRLGQI